MSTVKKRTESAFFTPDQVELIEKHILKDAPEFEVQRFLITCERTGLDPFSRQLYANVQRKKVKEGGQETWVKVVVIITSIDGFRAIAERSGEYRGQTKPEWYYTNDEGVAGWHDVFIAVRDQRGNPIKLPDACRVGIIRQGFAEPCYGVANFDSFAKYYKGDDGVTLDTFWKKMPEHMIAKVAEAQGHRKAFPLLACGLYVEEEVERENEELPVSQPEPEMPEDMTPVTPIKKAAKATPVSAPTPQQKTAPAPDVSQEKPPIDEEVTTVAAPTKKGGKKAAPAPEPEVADEPEFEGSQDGEEWREHVIAQITIPSIMGRKLGEMKAAEISSIYHGWTVKYAEKIKNNPAKVIEAEMITLAYQFHNPEKK